MHTKDCKKKPPEQWDVYDRLLNSAVLWPQAPGYCMLPDGSAYVICTPALSPNGISQHPLLRLGQQLYDFHREAGLVAPPRASEQPPFEDDAFSALAIDVIQYG